MKFAYTKLAQRSIFHLKKHQYPNQEKLLDLQLDPRLLKVATFHHPRKRLDFIVQSHSDHYLHPRGWSVSGRKLIRESMYELWLNRKRLDLPSFLQYIALRLTSKTEKIREPICLSYGAPNFWHFHNDLVYPLLLAHQSGLTNNHPVIVPSSWRDKPFFISALDNSKTLRSLNWIFQEPDRIMKVSRPIFISSAFGWPPNLIRAAREVMPSTSIPVSANHSRRLYVTRRGVSREASNEEEISALLLSRGFEVVDCSALSLADQAAAFRNAEVIVALHGASLANLAHVVKPNVHFLEIIPENWINPCFLWMALHKGMIYSCHISSASDVTHDGRTNVDLALLDKWLQKLDR